MTPPRWQYRYESFKRALARLTEAAELIHQRELSIFEKESLCSRFISTWEQTWRLLQEYLEYEGILLVEHSAALIIEEATEAKIIADKGVYLDMFDTRKQLAYAFLAEVIENATVDIVTRFQPTLKQLEELFTPRILVEQ